jgi:hypothetical protein
MCVCKVFVKTGIFMLYVKRQKLSCEKLFFSTKIYIFYIRHTIGQFFLKRLYGNLAREDIHANLLFQIL